MNRYIAFLRGINVGGKNIIKMEALRRSFEAMDLIKVKTYIQSGNVLFDSASKNTVTLTKKIEQSLAREYKNDIKVMLRSFSEIKNLVKLNPFKDIKADRKIKLYVCFSSDGLQTKPKLPIVSDKEGCEVIAIVNKELFIVSKELKNGRYGFPNNFIEKELGKSFTARNWNTVCKIAADSPKM